MSNITPTQAEVLRAAIDGRVVEISTALPAVVQRYDSSLQQADVQPCFRQEFEDGTVTNLPLITNVPVVFPRAGKSFISFPIKTGDQVLLIIQQRSIDEWSDTGGIVNPEDPRKLDLNDAVAIPGLYPFSDTINASSDNVRIQNDQSRIDLTPGGKFAFSNDSAGKELIDILKTHVTNLRDVIKVNTLLGPQPLVPTATLTTTINDLDDLKGE